MTTGVLPGGMNTFIPNHEATGNLVINFSRNPNKFALNRYAQIVPVKQTIGYYMNITVEEAGRIVDSDLSNLAWPDGNDAPTGEDGTEYFNFLQYICQRIAPTFRLGEMGVQQATWDVVAQHAAIKAQQAMTARTQRAMNQVQDSSKWGTHTSAVSSISGNTGNWLQSTTARQDIKRSLNFAAESILDDTLGAVEPSEISLVIGSGMAKSLAETQEIVDYIKGSPMALAQIRGELPSRNAIYGIPDTLYGFPVEVDITRKVTSRKGATRAATSVLDNTKPFMCSRPGGMVGVAGAPSFSTISIFVWEKNDMLVETKNDTDNKRVVGRVVDTAAAVVTAPASGYLFTSAM